MYGVYVLLYVVEVMKHDSYCSVDSSQYREQDK